MFKHNLKYSLKILLKNKSLIFWTFIFPILLGTLFKMAFSNIENSETLKIIDIAVVNDVNFNNDVTLKETIKYLSDETNEDKLFNTKYVDKYSASELLKNNDISGYIEVKNNNVIVNVNKSGINETIIKYVVDEVIRNNKIYENFIREGRNPYEITSAVKAKLNNISNENLSYTNIEFYTLLAMTALYGGLISMFISNKHQPNISAVGKRTSISCIKKSTLIFTNLLASYIIEVIGLFIVLAYTIFVLKADFGSNLPLVIVVTLAGALAGLAIGLVISLLKVKENAKTGILIGTTMMMSFFSGMYGITMKYVIDKNIPVINKINPTSLITDAYYSLYYYDTYSRYITNLVLLLLISGLLIGVSIIKLRRNRYDSI